MNTTLTQNQKLGIGIGGGLAIIGLIALLAASGSLADIAVWAVALLGLAIVVAVWASPIIIAVKRNHSSMMGIIALTVLFGWTFIGWLIALVWSLSNPSSAPTTVVINQQSPYGHTNGYGYLPQQPVPVMAPATDQPASYPVGAVVNGHRFDGRTWVQL